MTAPLGGRYCCHFCNGLGGVRGWVSRGVGVLLAYIDDFRL